MNKDPSIEFLELFAVTAGVLMWTKRHRNTRIVLFCNNESVVHMLNRQSSKCPNCIVLIRHITLQCMIDNVRLYAKHVRTFCNDRSDVLSRDLIDKFKRLSYERGIDINPFPLEIPDILKDIDKFWIHK